MTRRWQRSVPVFDVPIRTRTFYALCGLGALACGLSLYRECTGLGPVSGMNDYYAWGIWKTFNIMVLTGLGSGSFAIGVAVWLFGQHRLHSVMRTAVISSLLAYMSGLVLLGVDVGRPWNFYSILMPWRWNGHSPMLEVAFCMPLYASVPLFLEALPIVFEWLVDRFPQTEFLSAAVEGMIRRSFPFVLGLGLLLPAMHQSSLGALMLLAGPQVHPLWQTPLLPLLYVIAAGFMGFAFVTFLLFVAHLAWRREVDHEVLGSMSATMAWIVAVWLFLRTADLALRGSLVFAFAVSLPAVLFWVESALLAVSSGLAFVATHRNNLKWNFVASLLACIGGMLYRFDPTTLVYQPESHAHYFPTPVEILIGAGFAALAMAAYSVAAKAMAVLPAPLETWFAMKRAREAPLLETVAGESDADLVAPNKMQFIEQGIHP